MIYLTFGSRNRSNGYKQTSFTYDSLLRPLRVNLPGGAYVEYTWADNGRHLVRKVENGPTMASTYTWQDMVGLSSITDPTGHKEFYEYDSGNRLYTIKNGLSQTVTLYEYHIDTE